MQAILALITMLVLIVSALVIAIVHSGGYDNSSVAKFFNGLAWLGVLFVCGMTLYLKVMM